MICLWVCLVRREVFVGGESQRCRHSSTCSICQGMKVFGTEPCENCNGTGQVSDCGEMELIGGEPVEWCVVHDSKAATPLISMGPMQIGMCQQYSLTPSEGQDRCQFVSQVRVGP